MGRMTEENQLIKALESIAPDKDEFIHRRINHINFARVVIWLCIKTKKEDFVYASELAKFIKTSQTRAYVILNDLANIKIMRKKFPTSSLVEFWFELDNDTGRQIILNYFEQAKKTLGIEFEISLSQKIHK